MNKASLDKMFGLMIMAGWSKNQILKVLDELHSLHPNDVKQILDQVSESASDLNYRVSKITNRTNNNWFHPETNYFREPAIAYESFEGHGTQALVDNPMLSEIYDKVHEFLAVELNLTTPEIVDLMSAEIYQMHKGPIPPLSKKSLKNWIARLLNYYPPSEILHAVATIRNRHMGTNSMGWSLRNE